MRAILGNLRQSPRKVRLVADWVRGKKVDVALAGLGLMDKRAAAPVTKLIRSALANFPADKRAPASDYLISEIRVDAARTLKRQRPRARGRAAMIRKRASRIYLQLKALPAGRQG